MKRLLLLAVALALAPGCLVLSLNPAYEGETIGWDPALLGNWQDVDDKSSMEIERGEWKSYRIKYVHPVETGTLTGYLTAIGDDRFLDVMPARGEDRGSFLIPAHAVLRIGLSGDRLELTPLSYDWMNDRLRAGTRTPGLNAVLDQKENVLILTSTAALRAWLRRQPKDAAMFGAPAVFTRGVGGRGERASASRAATPGSPTRQPRWGGRAGVPPSPGAHGRPGFGERGRSQSGGPGPREH